MEYQFSERVQSLKPSAIREILKNSSDPNVIPLSAGNPAPDAFPYDAVRKSPRTCCKTLRWRRCSTALQKGIPPCGSTCVPI